MTIVQLQDENLQSAYNSANDNLKNILEILYPHLASPKGIMERVKTLEDACRVRGVKVSDLILFPTPRTRAQEIANDTAALEFIIETLNEGWEADYSDGKQKKWYPWFLYDTSLSAFRFHFAYFDNTFAHAGSGARQVLKSKELAKYMGTQFIGLYNKILKK